MKSIYEFLLKSKTASSTQNAYYDYVDLGLPSGLLWAKCNIGADEPYEYGDYFMWGSTSPDTDKPCDWENCPFNGGDNDFNEEYFKSVKNKVCHNDILTPEYDAATAILGDGWRLPTRDDFMELMHNTKHEWIRNYNNSDVNGMLFEANEIELFIPASGYRDWSIIAKQGRHAYLWSSSLYTSLTNYAMHLYFDDSCCYAAWNDRRYGFCLRGVTR